MPVSTPHVLILGAGINGAALARELALNGLDVTVVDSRDAAAGTTAYSSRLIHGGLRYLEYGDFALVRESLAERTRLLRLAPHLVHPLRLFIPVRNRSGGLWTSARRFWRLRERPGSETVHRGLWTVGLGLWFYDLYARDRSLPRRRAYAANSSAAVRVDARQFRWLYSYSDAQVRYPERFTVALLADAHGVAAQTGREFRLLTYHRVILEGTRVRIVPVASRGDAGDTVDALAPAAIVNATGPWVDQTLSGLSLPSPRLIGGTKGTHFLTWHVGLRERLDGRGLYAEATDGRPVFILPFGQATLVGTTDIPFDGDPAAAVATPEELDYLLSAVNGLFADLQLEPSDIAMHYCGVRPLPYSGPATPAGVSRRHWLEPGLAGEIPLYSLVGGKLTTCRSLAEQGAATILARLNREPTASSRERPLRGAEDYPPDAATLAAEHQRLTARFGLPLESIAAVWSLVGTRTESALAEGDQSGSQLLSGTFIPRRFAEWSIRHEWATTLEDLVERRLMLLFEPELSRDCLRDLAALLVAAGRLPEHEVDSAVSVVEQRLATRFGKRLI